jgi:hypothetical protein
MRERSDLQHIQKVLTSYLFYLKDLRITIVHIKERDIIFVQMSIGTIQKSETRI